MLKANSKDKKPRKHSNRVLLQYFQNDIFDIFCNFTSCSWQSRLEVETTNTSFCTENFFIQKHFILPEY